MSVYDLSQNSEKKIIAITTWVDRESKDQDIYLLVNKRVFKLAYKYLEEGRPPSDIRKKLKDALKNFPAWRNLSLEELERFQRENVVGKFLLSRGDRIESDFDLSIDLY